VILLGFVGLTLRPTRAPADALLLAEEHAALEQASLTPPPHVADAVLAAHVASEAQPESSRR
jgi:hypothetical protein